MKYADEARSPCSTTRVPAGMSRTCACRMKSARWAGREPGEGREAAGQAIEVGERGRADGRGGQARGARGRSQAFRRGAPRRDAEAGCHEGERRGHEQERRREHDEDADVDDVGETGAGHPDQEDDVAHDVERREHAAAHLARRGALQQDRARHRRRRLEEAADRDHEDRHRDGRRGGIGDPAIAHPDEARRRSRRAPAGARRSAP